MMTKSKPRRKNKNWLVIAIIAFFIQGGWTLGVNYSHGLGAAVPPSVMQGVLSGFSAGGMTLIMEWIFRVVPPSPLRPIASVLGTSLIMATFLTGLHRMIGTPEIAATLLLPMVAVVLYATVYTVKLTRHKGATSQEAPLSGAAE